MTIEIIITELSPGMYKAHCPVLPGCLAFGRSRQETLGRMLEAVEDYLASIDAAVPEDIKLEILDYGRDLRETFRGNNQAVLALRPGCSH